MLNATRLYRRLEIYSHRKGVSMAELSKNIFGCSVRISLWRDGRVPPQSRLVNVVQFLDDVGGWK